MKPITYITICVALLAAPAAQSAQRHPRSIVFLHKTEAIMTTGWLKMKFFIDNKAILELATKFNTTVARLKEAAQRLTNDPTVRRWWRDLDHMTVTIEEHAKAIVGEEHFGMRLDRKRRSADYIWEQTTAPSPQNNPVPLDWGDEEDEEDETKTRAGLPPSKTPTGASTTVTPTPSPTTTRRPTPSEPTSATKGLAKGRSMELFGLQDAVMGIAAQVEIKALKGQMTDIEDTEALQANTTLRALREINETMALIANYTEKLGEIVEFDHLALFANSIEEQGHRIINYLYEVELGLALLRQGGASPLLIKFAAMRRAKERAITEAAKVGAKLATEATEELFNFPTRFYANEKEIKVIISIPLTNNGEKKVNLMEYHPAPVWVHWPLGHPVLLSPKARFLATDDKFGTIFTRDQLRRDCAEYNEVYFCDNNIRITRLESTCLGALYVGKLKEAARHCPSYQVQPGVSVTKLGPTRFLLSAPREVTVTQACNAKDMWSTENTTGNQASTTGTRDFKVLGARIIKLPQDCVLEAPDVLVIPDKIASVEVKTRVHTPGVTPFDLEKWQRSRVKEEAIAYARIKMISGETNLLANDAHLLQRHVALQRQVTESNGNMSRTLERILGNYSANQVGGILGTVGHAWHSIQGAIDIGENGIQQLEDLPDKLLIMIYAATGLAVIACIFVGLAFCRGRLSRLRHHRNQPQHQEPIEDEDSPVTAEDHEQDQQGPGFHSGLTEAAMALGEVLAVP